MKKLLIIALSLSGTASLHAQNVTNTTLEDISLRVIGNCVTGTSPHFVRTIKAGTVEPTTNWTTPIGGAGTNDCWFISCLFSACPAYISYGTAYIAQVGNSCGYTQSTTEPMGANCASPVLPSSLIYFELDPVGNINIHY